MGLIENAQRDRVEGRLWKARQRLEGSLPSRPADQECLELLGQVCWEMKDQPAAGRAWYLTNLETSEANEAREAYREAWGDKPINLLRNLVIKAPLDSYPDIVRSRIQPIIEAAATDGYKWVEPSASKTTRIPPPPETKFQEVFGIVGVLIAVVVVLAFLVSLIGLIIFGIASFAGWLTPDVELGIYTDDSYYFTVSKPQIAATIAAFSLLVCMTVAVVLSRRKQRRARENAL